MTSGPGCLDLLGFADTNPCSGYRDKMHFAPETAEIFGLKPQ
jgi:hypothetical protein